MGNYNIFKSVLHRRFVKIVAHSTGTAPNKKYICWEVSSIYY